MPCKSLGKPMVLNTHRFIYNRGIPAARIPYKHCRKSIVSEITIRRTQHANAKTKIPNKPLGKLTILGTRMPLDVQKIHAARFPYKTC